MYQRVSASISLMGRYVCPTKFAFRWLVGVLSTVTRSNMCAGRITTGSMLDRRPRSGYAVKRQTSISCGSPGEIDGCQRSQSDQEGCVIYRCNISDRALTLHEGSKVAMWLSGDRIPRIPGYVSVGSRRYAEWQNLAYQATTDEISEVDINEQVAEPAVECPKYVIPTAILPRPEIAVQNIEIAGDGDVSLPLSKCTSDQGKIDPDNSNDLHTKIEANTGDPMMDDEVCIKEGGTEPYVEDQMAVLPEVTATTEEVKIEDLQIDDANINTQEEIERLVQIIWKRKHLLIGKGNALPPPAKGVVCDIDVGNAKPVAQRCRKVAIQFREKLYQLIKGLLSARMIRHSTHSTLLGRHP
ncbi:Hypothetical protein PHPALM_10217 [Phytophthora palmivora]|uniref:Reverse transcriptase n=1 Tax=Phytophthora palmivora TaxID=4796 RepID=A0A2P4Y5A9_9STRA|nr:Hypothetical protein PHPALM_10217 [Phytophthora palmivora]